MDHEDYKDSPVAIKFRKLLEEKRRLRAKGVGPDFESESDESSAQTDELAQTDEFIEPDTAELNFGQDHDPHESEEIDVNDSIDDTDNKKKPHSAADRGPPFSRLPTSMTRTSPFFIISRKDMKNRPIEKISVGNSWGRVTFEGERLSIYDETTFLTLLKVAKRKKFKPFCVTRYGLCKILGIKPHSDTYKAVWNSIKRLSKTHVTIEIGDGKNEKKVEIGGTLISSYLRVRKGGKETISIHFNPYFLQMDQAKLITRIQLQFRSELKGDVAKALYRFYKGQRNFYVFNGIYGCYLLTLCKAINLSVDEVPLWRLRDRIKRGLEELKRHGFLKYQIAKNDFVTAKEQKRPKLSEYDH